MPIIGMKQLLYLYFYRSAILPIPIPSLSSYQTDTNLKFNIQTDIHSEHKNKKIKKYISFKVKIQTDTD